MVHNSISIKIAGIIITIKSNVQLSVSDNFIPFVQKTTSDDNLAYIIQNTGCFEPEGRIICSDFDSDIFKRNNGTTTRWYKSLKDDMYYAFYEKKESGEHSVTIFKPESIKNLNQAFHMIGWEAIFLKHDRMILHSSCIKTSKGGILFSGQSGIGKSTQAELWLHHRKAHLINGDRTVVYKEYDEWYGCGSPFAGSSSVYLNEEVPIKAIVFLEQSKTNIIRRISRGAAFKKLYANMVIYPWDRYFIEKIISLISILITEIPVFVLSCTPDIKAVEKLEEVL